MPFFAAELQFDSAARESLGQTLPATFLRDGLYVLNRIFPASISCANRTTRLVLRSVVDSGLPTVPCLAAPPDLLPYMRSEV